MDMDNDELANMVINKDRQSVDMDIEYDAPLTTLSYADRLIIYNGMTNAIRAATTPPPWCVEVVEDNLRFLVGAENDHYYTFLVVEDMLRLIRKIIVLRVLVPGEIISGITKGN